MILPTWGGGGLALMLQTQACCENMDWAWQSVEVSLGSGRLDWWPGLASLFVFVFVVGSNQPVNHPNALLITFFSGIKLLEHSRHSLRDCPMTSQCHITSADGKPI